MQNIKCTTGVLKELMYMLSRFISARGLFEFVLDGLEDDIVIDVGAIRGILEASNELRKLSVRNTNWTQSEDYLSLLCGILP